MISYKLPYIMFDQQRQGPTTIDVSRASFPTVYYSYYVYEQIQRSNLTPVFTLANMSCLAIIFRTYVLMGRRLIYNKSHIIHKKYLKMAICTQFLQRLHFKSMFLTCLYKLDLCKSYDITYAISLYLVKNLIQDSSHIAIFTIILQVPCTHMTTV